MEKIQLSSVTLICADCRDLDKPIASIEKCKSKVEFGAVKFLTSLETEYPHIVIPPLTSLVMYSIFCLKEMYKYVDTEHFLICQGDGWIINPESWNPEWLNYDYISPLFNQYNLVGAGGFSLRSKKMMEVVSKTIPYWDGTLEGADKLQKGIGTYEDGYISITLRRELAAQGFKFAPVMEACKFCSGGNYNENYYVERPFGNHQGNYYYRVRETGIDDGIIPKNDYTEVK